jgi:hypothetical protein
MIGIALAFTLPVILMLIACIFIRFTRKKKALKKPEVFSTLERTRTNSAVAPKKNVGRVIDPVSSFQKISVGKEK